MRSAGQVLQPQMFPIWRVATYIRLIVRFLNKFTGKKLKEARPELIKQFENKAERSKMFTEFVLNGENVDHVALLQARRQIRKKKAGLVTRPFPETSESI